MHIELTNKEDFLIGITAYLIYGGDLVEDDKRMRSEDEVRAILNNSNAFKDIDVLKDELSYYDLSENEFVWEKGQTVMNDLNIVLKDDATLYGGVAYAGETLIDFINDLEASERQSLDDVNVALIECGILPINKRNYPEIKNLNYLELVKTD